MGQTQEQLRQATADLLSTFIAQESADQTNLPISNGTSTDRMKIFDYYRESPHLEAVHQTMTELGSVSPESAIDRAGHIRGLFHEGMSHILIRALLQESKDKTLVALSPQLTGRFTSELREIFVGFDSDDEIPSFNIEPDILLVNRKKLLVQEDIECTLKKYSDKKPRLRADQPPDYFISKQSRFETARDALPFLFTSSSVCRFVLLKGREIPSQFSKPRNSPYTDIEFDAFSATLMTDYRPARNQQSLIESCAELMSFVTRFLPQTSKGKLAPVPIPRFSSAGRNWR